MNGGKPADCAGEAGGEDRGSRRLLTAAALLDATGIIQPGALLLEGSTILAVGAPEKIGAVGPEVTVEAWHGDVLLPALVNAHAHLDLTHIGRRPEATSFLKFVDRVRRERVTEPAEVAASVRRGVELARLGGTGLLGDIAGAPFECAAAALAAAGMPGVSYREYFGIGRGRTPALERLAAARGEAEAWREPETQLRVRAGVQPHAPYSCAAETYRAAQELSVPMATHLAETLDEERFVGAADGALVEFLDELNLLDSSIVAQEMSPVAWWAATIGGERDLNFVPQLVAHVNYLQRGDLERLAQSRAVVAYCPRASAYFGHPQEGRRAHAYRAMIEAGIPVALGTDSIIGLDRDDRLSVLDEMRWLAQRDGASLDLLLSMATVNGARGLGFDPGLVTLAPGRSAGIIALPLERGATVEAGVLHRHNAPRWAMLPELDGGARPA